MTGAKHTPILLGGRNVGARVLAPPLRWGCPAYGWLGLRMRAAGRRPRVGAVSPRHASDDTDLVRCGCIAGNTTIQHYKKYMVSS